MSSEWKPSLVTFRDELRTPLPIGWAIEADEQLQKLLHQNQVVEICELTKAGFIGIVQAYCARVGRWSDMGSLM